MAAANHGGRSSVTAAAAGAIEGVRFGESFLPGSWLEHLERADFIGMVGDKVCLAHDRHQAGNA